MPRPHAFTSKQVSRLSGISVRALHYWDDTDVYPASFKDERSRVPYRRIYTFRDLVSLRTLAWLRKEHKVTPEDIRQTGKYLRETYPEMADPWSELRFGVVNRRVVFWNSETKEWIAPPGQHVLPVDVQTIAHETERDAARLLQRSPEDVGQVVQHRHILRNAWRLAGTRIPTSAIWHFHEDGSDVEEILREYPDLEEADVWAAIEHERNVRGVSAA